MRSHFISLLILLLASLASPLLLAAPGDLDTSFGGTGKVITAVGSSSDAGAHSVIQQADGKLVLAGDSYFTDWTKRVSLVRYNVDGSLDTSFDGDGKLSIDIAGQSYKMIQQFDGKLVLAGYSTVGVYSNFILLRFNPDGSLDASFDSDGKLTTDVGGYSDIGYSVVQQLDGKLVVAGGSCIVVDGVNCSQPTAVMVRYNTDGSLDASFGSGGKLITDLVGSAHALIQQADSKLVVIGYNFIARYELDGSLDTSFAGDGKFEVVRASSLIQQTDGKLVVTQEPDNYSGIATLLRFNGDGTLDTSFDGDGIQSADFGDYPPRFSYACANSFGSMCPQPFYGRVSLIQQADSQLVIAGPGAKPFSLLRFHSDGSLDTGFVIDRPPPPTCMEGSIPFSSCYEPIIIWSGSAAAFSLAQQTDGKLIAAGRDDGGEFAIRRYESGQVDSDSDGVFDELDGDDDGDGVVDVLVISAISAGLNHACALGNTGVHCWGRDDYGQASVPTLVSPVAVSAGGIHTCALDNTGVHCWGDNTYGQTAVPALVNPVAVSAGFLYTCALDSTGVHCWGYNVFGEATVPALVNPVAVSAGVFNTCALDDTGVHCWGDSRFGKNTVPALVNPVVVSSAEGHVICALDSIGVHCWGSTSNDGVTPVPALVNPVAVSAGVSHACALDDTGAHCWGSNNFGESTVPTLETPVAISAGSKYTCALDNTGVHCWGDNTYGQTNVPSIPLDNCLFVANASQTDTDHDGIGDACDTTPNGDTDGDGIDNLPDNCPTVSNVNQLDTDHDGIGNACDSTPNGDTDGDGVDNLTDNCLTISNAAQTDADHDGIGDACDTTPNGDADGDGIDNLSDNCPTVSNAAQMDTDHDGIGDACDTTPNGDTDGDGVDNLSDNCPAISNPNQIDIDLDGIGDACDTDDDNDGVPDVSDNCSLLANANQLNIDGDTQGNVCDPDNDNDGVPDISDAFPLDPQESADTDGDGRGNNADNDDDGDKVPDKKDAFPLDATESVDADGDGIGNNADTDDDNDGLSDTAELSLRNDPFSNLDPPMVLINAEPVLAGADLLVGLDNHTAGASVFTTAWSSVDGVFASDGVCDNCVAPNINATMTAGGDLCGVNTKGVFCLWWGMDSGTVHGDELLPIQVAGQTYNPLHDWDGYLKYVDQSSVLHNVATDAFKVSGDHHSHACIVSKTLGVYCWASHSGTDIVSGNIPAALQNVSTIKDVAVGANHACAINNAAVQCWGDATSGKTTVLGAVNAPTQIAAGADHTCAINVNGTVSCWGDNSNGQLGDFDMDGLVDGVSSALNIAAGSNHTCAVTGSYSTPSSLRVTCWGKNNIGQTSVPTSFTNGVDKPVNVTAAGNETCAIKAGQNVAAAALVCWPVGLVP